MTHPALKRWYRHRTNKRGHVQQLTTLERINARVRQIENAINPQTQPTTARQQEAEDDRMLPLIAKEHHYIPPSRNMKLEFDSLDLEDPAARVRTGGHDI
jgi:hypothetical protein